MGYWLYGWPYGEAHLRPPMGFKLEREMGHGRSMATSYHVPMLLGHNHT
jgi:hypothetical protein